MNPLQTQRQIKFISTDPIILGACAGEQHYLWRTFTQLSTFLVVWMLSGNSFCSCTTCASPNNSWSWCRRWLEVREKGRNPIGQIPKQVLWDSDEWKGKQERDRDLCPQGRRGGRMSSAVSSPVQPATRQLAGRHGLVSKHFLDEKTVNTTCWDSSQSQRSTVEVMSGKKNGWEHSGDGLHYAACAVTRDMELGTWGGGSQGTNAEEVRLHYISWVVCETLSIWFGFCSNTCICHNFALKISSIFFFFSPLSDAFYLQEDRFAIFLYLEVTM